MTLPILMNDGPLLIERQLLRVPYAPDSSQTTQGMTVIDGVT
jgi:hypothetical protein